MVFVPFFLLYIMSIFESLFTWHLADGNIDAPLNPQKIFDLQGLYIGFKSNTIIDHTTTGTTMGTGFILKRGGRY
jgi:hypothetical protein